MIDSHALVGSCAQVGKHVHLSAASQLGGVLEPVGALPVQNQPVSKNMDQNQVTLTQSCLTLCDPMDCSPPGSSVHGIFQARMLEWVAIPSSRGSNLGLLHCQQILYHLSYQGSPQGTGGSINISSQKGKS